MCEWSQFCFLCWMKMFELCTSHVIRSFICWFLKIFGQAGNFDDLYLVLFLDFESTSNTYSISDISSLDSLLSKSTVISSFFLCMVKIVKFRDHTGY